MPVVVLQRRCTDIPCLLVFLGFLCGWGYIAYFAFTNGLLARIVHPTNSHGQICGMDDTASRPYLLYFDITRCMDPSVVIAGCLAQSVCVAHCPNTTFTYLSFAATALAEPMDFSQLICIDEVDKVALAVLSRPAQMEVVFNLVKTEQCAAYYLPSGPVGGRCLPGLLEGSHGQAMTAFGDINSNVTVDHGTVSMQNVFNASTWIHLYAETQEVLKKVVVDFQSSWKIIVAGLVTAALVSFCWIILLRWIAGPMIVISVLGILGGLLFGMYVCYQEYAQIWNREIQASKNNSVNGTVKASMIVINDDLTDHSDLTISGETFLSDKKTYLGFGSASLALFLIFLVLFIFLRKRVVTAVALLRASSRAVSSMISALFFPLLPLILQLVVIGSCVACSVWLAATGKPVGYIANATDDARMGQRENDTCDPNTFLLSHLNTTARCKFLYFSKDPNLLYFQLYNFFGLLWGFCFVVALEQHTLAGAFASYYWAFNKPRDIPDLPVFSALYRSVRYHLGSLAFGSLLVALVKFMRYMLTFIQKKVKKGNNWFTRVLTKVCAVCFYCLEKCIKFINKYAYITMAIFGTNFCVSAKDAFSLLARNALRVIVVDSVVAFFLFFGKLLILGGIGCGFYYFLSRKIPGLEQYVPTLSYIWVPITTILVGTYVIATMFFGVYVMAMDTMFVCFLEDLERNNGSEEKPYYMSKSLMNIYAKTNRLSSLSKLSKVEVNAVSGKMEGDKQPV